MGENVKTKRLISDFQLEIDMMCQLRHPNVLLFMGSCEMPEMCIVTEYMDKGALSDILEDHDVQLSQSQIRQWMLQAARGLQYLHERSPPIMHCDLKAANLFVDGNNVLKVADFGLTMFFGEDVAGAGGSDDNKDVTRGSLLYMSKEVLEGREYTLKSDVYSFGIVMYEALERKVPYLELIVEVVEGLTEAEKAANNRRMVLSTKIAPRIAAGYRPKYVNTDPEYCELMTQCWAIEPQDRPYFGTVAQRLEAICNGDAEVRKF